MITIKKLELLKHDFANIEADDSWSFRDASRMETSYITHGFHRYPAKFIPHIARRLIREYTNSGDAVLDPFMGSGTTLVEASISNRDSFGVDINPVSCLISRAKTNSFEPEYLSLEIGKILSQIEVKKKRYFEGQYLVFDKSETEFSKVIPKNQRIDFWFPDEMIQLELAIILHCISNTTKKVLKEFFLCCFSNILKNASIWSNRSTKPTRDLNKKVVAPSITFRRHLRKMERGNLTYRELQFRNNGNKDGFKYHKAKPILGSSTDLPYKDNSINLIVTSPPYVTSYEYADIHQLSAYWLGYIKDLPVFRKKFIGSISKIADEQSVELKIPYAQDLIENLEEISKREAKGVSNYFVDMQISLKEMYRVLKKKGRACIVIGNTRLKKKDIKNAEIFTEMMEQIGFKLDKVIKREIISKILPQTRDESTGRFSSTKNADSLAYPHEFIIILQKN